MADTWHHMPGGDRRKRRPPDPWFIGAWVFLVVVVAVAFFIQASIIERIERDEQAIEELVERSDAQQRMNAEAICQLLVVRADSTKEVRQTVIVFRTLGYNCPQAKGG